MDQTLSFTHQFDGHPGFLIPMLGAVRFMEEWIIGEIQREQGINKKPLCADDKANSLVIEVPKEVALAHYWQAMEKLRERVIAIDKSAPHAIFQIDSKLLSRL